VNLLEVGQFLAALSAHDNRTTSAESMEVWHQALDKVPYELARQALAEHIRTSTDYVQPAHIVAGARKLWQGEKADSDEIRRRALERAALERGQQQKVADPTDYGPRLLRTMLKAALGAPRAYPGGPVAPGMGQAAAMAALEGFREREGLSPYAETPRVTPCRNSLCVCTHTDGCLGGFMAIDDADPAASVVPCPMCKPKAATITTNAKGDRMAAQRLLREQGKEPAAAGRGDDW
jgi:hypothetical protein